MTPDIARAFATESMDGTFLSGFTIERNDDDAAWTVSDGTTSEDHESPADALATYAAFMEAFVSDVDEHLEAVSERGADGVECATAAEWLTEIARARAEEMHHRAAQGFTIDDLRNRARVAEDAVASVRQLAVALVATRAASEVQAAGAAGVHRTTLRGWLGK